MKKIITAAALLVSFSLISSVTLAFGVGANCTFNAATGRCAVFNNWARPIVCALNIQGVVASGAYFYGNEQVVVYPGQFAYAFVNANNPQFDPLVRVGGSANCSF